jgi:hypothetical protein
MHLTIRKLNAGLCSKQSTITRELKLSKRYAKTSKRPLSVALDAGH